MLIVNCAHINYLNCNFVNFHSINEIIMNFITSEITIKSKSPATHKIWRHEADIKGNKLLVQRYCVAFFIRTSFSIEFVSHRWIPTEKNYFFFCFFKNTMNRLHFSNTQNILAKVAEFSLKFLKPESSFILLAIKSAVYRSF